MLFPQIYANGAFVLQAAKEAVVFQDGEFLRMKTVWQDAPIVDNADRTEPTGLHHIRAAEAVEEG